MNVQYESISLNTLSFVTRISNSSQVYSLFCHPFFHIYLCIVPEQLEVALGQELVVEHALGELEAVALQLPQPDLVAHCGRHDGLLEMFMKN